MPFAFSRRCVKVLRPRKHRREARPPIWRKLVLECLEDRTLPSGTPLSGATLLTFDALQGAHAASRLAASNAFDLYRVNLHAGDVVSATVSALANGSGLQSVLRVFDSAGHPLAMEDQEGGDPRLTFQASTADDYFVGVSSAGDDAYDPNVFGSGQAGVTTGAYSLDLRRTLAQPLAADLAGASFRLQTDTAAYDDQVSGTFTVENRGGANAAAFDVDVVLSTTNRFDPSTSPHWTVAHLTGLSAGHAQTYNFTITLPNQPVGFDPTGPVYLGLRIDPAGGVPELNPLDQSGVHRGADWETLTIVTPGVASGSNHSLAAADVLADPNSRISGALTAGQTDWYQFTLSDAERLTAQVAAVGGTLAPRLALYGPGGQLLIQSDGGAITQPLQAGTYYLSLSSRSGAGNYQLISQVIPAGPALDPLAVSQPARSAVVADLNGDGKPDLIIANGGTVTSPGDTVSVLLGNGDGTYQPPQSYTVGSLPQGLAVADVNGDGIPDLVTANALSDTVSVLLGNGDGTFQPQQTLDVGSVPIALAVADLDGDGRPDLVTANYGDGTVSVLLNNTTSGAASIVFSPVRTFDVGSVPTSVVVADVDRNGKPDLITANDGSDTVSVLLGNGDGTFKNQQTFPAGSQPIAVTAADVNGDGKPDLIAANYGTNTVSVLLGNGDGTFQAPQTFVVGSQPIAVAVADVNGDGKPDLIAANFGSASATVSVLLNQTATGSDALSFTPRPAFAVGGDPKTVAVADINGDGIPDLVTANYIGGTAVSVLLGNGDGSFQNQQAFAVGSNAVAVAVADLNGDGKSDLVTANSGANTVSVLLGNGDGTFQNQQTFPVGPHPTSVAVADLNGDGRPDLVVANRGTGLAPGDTVSVLLGNGDGTFQPQQTITVGSEPGAVAVADVNGDGIPDLIVANIISDTVSVLLGNGDGTFQPQQTFAVGASPVALAVADINHDDKPDLITANYDDGTVSVLLNQTKAGDHNLVFAPQQTFPVGTDPLAVAAVDVDGDGRPDLVTANYEDGTVSVLLNQTKAGAFPAVFDAQQTYSVGGSPSSVAVADVTGDGKPDLVVVNSGSASVSVLPGNGDGTFQNQEPYGTDSFPAAVAVADVNGDRRPDLSVVTDLGNTVSVLMATGDGSFTSPSEAVGVGLRDTPYRVDLNDDGTPDTVVLDRAGNILFRAGLPGTNNQFAPPVILNPGRPARDIAVVNIGAGWAIAAADAAPDLALSSPGHPVYDISLYTVPSLRKAGVTPEPVKSVTRTTAFITTRLPTRITAGDLTGDGLDDLVVASALENSVTVALQTAPGLFAAAAPLTVGVAPSDLALVDVNGDNLRDIVVTDQASGDVSVLLNDPTHSFQTDERFRAGTGLYSLDTTSGAAAVSSLLQPVSLAAGNFTGDGRNDLVVVNRGAHSFTVLPNDGDGFADPEATLTTSTSDGLAINEQPGPVVAGDFNGDGKLDLAILMEDSAQVWIYTGDGQGHFTHTFTIAAGSQPTGLSVVRNPRTGFLDLLVGDQFGDVLDLQGLGNGTFQPPPPLSGDRVPLDVQTLPNGQNAVLVANQQQNQVVIQTAASGSAQFTQAAVLASGAQQTVLAPGAVKLYNLEGGRSPFDDAVVIGSGSNNILVYRAVGINAAGRPTFAPPVSYPVGQDPVSVTIQDINNDGIPDMLVANRGSNDVSVLFGEIDAAGNWTARPGPRLKSGGQGPVAVTVRDMNGDGIPDLVVTNGQSGTLGVLPGVGQGFFNDHAIQILNIPGNPLIGAPSFAGSSGAGVVVTGDGRIIGFNLGDFDASVRTVFLPSPGQAVSAVWALRDGGVVAAEEDGVIVLLEPGPGSSLFQLGQPLAPLTGIPSDPSALAVLEGQFGLQVFVTSAGQDRVYLFEPLSGLLLPGPSIGPSLPPLTPGPPTLVSAALGEELAVGVILSGGLLFTPESIPTAGPAIIGQPLSGLTAPSAFDDDSAGNQLPNQISDPSQDRTLDSQIEELLQKGKPNVLADGAVPDISPASVAPPDDSAAPSPFSQPVSQGQVPPVSGLSYRGEGTGVVALPSAARADSGEPEATRPAAEFGWLPRTVANPGVDTKEPAAIPKGNAGGRDWDRAWIAILALIGLPAAFERHQLTEKGRTDLRRRTAP